MPSLRSPCLRGIRPICSGCRVWAASFDVPGERRPTGAPEPVRGEAVTPQPRNVQYVYLTLMLFSTLAASFIWGITTLFLLDAGLSATAAFAANACFTAGMVLFEVPTGVVADIWGRRTSYLLGASTLAVSTVLYWVAWRAHAPFWAWAVTSGLLGLGFTFVSGATEAWLVDALRHTGFQGSLEPVFAKAQVVSGVAMLCGSMAGGLVAQLTNLGVPYVLRALALVVTLVVAYLHMKDWGFAPKPSGRPLGEMRQVLRDSLRQDLGAARRRAAQRRAAGAARRDQELLGRHRGAAGLGAGLRRYHADPAGLHERPDPLGTACHGPVVRQPDGLRRRRGGAAGPWQGRRPLELPSLLPHGRGGAAGGGPAGAAGAARAGPLGLGRGPAGGARRRGRGGRGARGPGPGPRGSGGVRADRLASGRMRRALQGGPPAGDVRGARRRPWRATAAGR